ncbi:MAG: ribbon-helix-helix protein, CopG family [Chloroflexi bacterium]|nr:ribbon-helix-helix protein, CopG family [Chloroflexota bacterium]
MASTTVRISEATRAILRDLAAQSGQSMQALIEQAVEDYRRRRFFEQVDAAYAALRANPDEWQAELQERALLEGTLADGLDEG